MREVLIRGWYKVPDTWQTVGEWQSLYQGHSRHQGMWSMPSSGVCLCPNQGWEPRQESRSNQGVTTHHMRKAAWQPEPPGCLLTLRGKSSCPVPAWPLGTPASRSAQVPLHAPLLREGWGWCTVAPLPAAPEQESGAASPEGCRSEAISGCSAPTAPRSEGRRMHSWQGGWGCRVPSSPRPQLTKGILPQMKQTKMHSGE